MGDDRDLVFKKRASAQQPKWGEGAGFRPADVDAVSDIPDVVTSDIEAAVEGEDAVNVVYPDTKEDTRRDPVDIRDEPSRHRLRSKSDWAAIGLLKGPVEMDDGLFNTACRRVRWRKSRQ